MKYIYIVLIAAVVFTTNSCEYPDDEEVLKSYSYNPNNKSDDSEETEEQDTYPTIDLGLSSGTKWCQWNIGATSETEYGEYFTWSDALKSVPPGYKMPTLNQAAELISECSWTTTTINGVKGSLGVGPNKKTIFLPKGGIYKYFSLEKLSSLGEQGSWWVNEDVTNDYSPYPKASTILVSGSVPQMFSEAQATKVNLRCVK